MSRLEARENMGCRAHMLITTYFPAPYTTVEESHILSDTPIADRGSKRENSDRGLLESYGKMACRNYYTTGIIRPRSWCGLTSMNKKLEMLRDTGAVQPWEIYQGQGDWLKWSWCRKDPFSP